MKRKSAVTTAIALSAFFLTTSAMAQGAQSPPRVVTPTSAPDTAYPYHLFPTTNIWTQILLDTATGRVWQVQFAVGDSAPAGKWVINESSLLPPGSTPENGRFTLYPTQNMYTFLLLDRQDSRIWQLQWSAEPKNRGIVRSIN
jgi:hypothetical protein